MRRAVLVVREGEVRAAALDVVLVAEPVQGDGRALDVPAGAPLTEVGGPRRLALAGHAPQERVERVPLAPTVGVAAALREHLAHPCLVVARDVAEVPGGGVVVVDVRELGVVGAVGRAAGQELAHQLADLVHGLDGPDEVARREDPQRGHVLAEQRRLAHPEHDPVVHVPLGPLEQRIVDVGDVLDVVHVVARVEPQAVDQVERQVGRRVAEVRRVVGRDAADVHPGGGARRGGSDVPTRRVVEPQRGRAAGHPRDVDR